MEQYEALEMRVTDFDAEDVIATSPVGTTNWQSITTIIPENPDN